MLTSMKNLKNTIDEISDQIEPAYPDPREQKQVAWWMLQAITGLNRATLLARQPEITKDQQAQLDDWIIQQVKHQKPLQYLIGFVPFLDLSITIEPPIAIPRPETEFWLDELIHLFKPLKEEKLKILDLCTGSGCIALGLAHALPQAHITGVDINEKAIELANQNKKNNNIENAEFLYSDLFTNLHNQKFDIIISNPPYISPEDWEKVSPRVRNWEDERAMRADEQGYAIIRSIIDQAPHYLKTPSTVQEQKLPQLVLEIGYQQGARTKELLTERGYANAQIIKDQYGNDRLALASFS